MVRTSLTSQVDEPGPTSAARGLASHCTPLPSFRLSVSVSLSLPISVYLWDTRYLSGTGQVWVADARHCWQDHQCLSEQSADLRPQSSDQEQRLSPGYR